MRHDAAKNAKPRGPESTTTAGDACRIELLGWLRVRQGERLIPRFRTRQTGALLAYLALFRQRSHPRELLIELLWPAVDGDPRHQLRNALSALRRQLEPPGTPAGAVLVADRATVRLNPDAVTTDVGDFEAALAMARQARSAIERGRWLTEAVALYRGELLPGYFESWIMPERQRLEEAYLEALVQLARQAETAGALAQAVEWARRAVATDPLHEEAQHALIRMLMLAGERDAARRQYDEFEQQLRERLGVAPDPETGALLRESVVPERRPLIAAEPRSDREASASAPPAAPSRPSGTVTFLLIEAVAPQPRAENARAAAAMVREWPLRALQRHGGEPIRFGSDSRMAVFARASEAVATAVAAMEGVGHISSSVSGGVPDTKDEICPGPRMALHTGELERDAEEYRGPALEHAVRLLLAAHPGQLLCSEATAALLRAEQEPGKPGHPLVDLGVYRLRDGAGDLVRERLFQIRSAGMPPQFPPPLGALPLAGDLPLRLTRFFGREAEIEALVHLLGGIEHRGAETLSDSPAVIHRDGQDEQDGDEGRTAPHPVHPVHPGEYPSVSPCLRVEIGPPPDSARLVTLTGPGGSGKTRLALELAQRLVESFGGAIWFVPLADLTEARQIPEAVRSAMRLPRTPHLEPLDQVVNALNRSAPGQPALLLLDNFEQLVADGAAVVRTLLERAPALSVLITSRQALELEGEQEYPIAPLPVPAVNGEGSVVSGRGGPSSFTTHHSPLTTCPSVRLFVDRAQAAQPDFQLTAANAAVVAALCAKLEGLPLAIELAAARAGTLTPKQMLAQLEHRFQFLVSRMRHAIDRHRSLEAALDWSYRLLAPELQRFLARLSVFRGGFTLEAAEAILDFGFWILDCPAKSKPPGRPVPVSGQSKIQTLRGHPKSKTSQEALEGIEQLRECSLLTVEAAGVRGAGSGVGRDLGPATDPSLLTPEAEIRYRLLETVREYAAGKLERRREAGAARLCHTRFFLALAEAAEPHLWANRQGAWFDRIAGEHDNLRAALAWAVERGEGALALRLAATLSYFWEVRGHWTEGRDRMAQVLALPEAAAHTPARAKALLRAGWLAHALADFAAARRLWEECLAIEREIGNRPGLATVLTSLGKLAAWPEEDPATARALLEESLAIRRELNDREGMGSTLDGLGNLLRTQGEYEGAWRLLEESVALRRAAENKAGIAWSLRGLGNVACGRGEFARARPLLTESLALFRELEYPQGIALTLENLWLALHCLADAGAARAVLGERLAISAALGSQAMLPQCLEDGALAAQAQGEPRRAALLFAAAAALRETLGISLTPTHRASLNESRAALRELLGETAFAAAWAAGRALTPDQAAAAALSPDPAAAP